jgi:HK97 family phage portal protein
MTRAQHDKTLFSRIAGIFAKRAAPQDGPTNSFRIPWFRRSGVLVTPETAMTLSAVYRAITFISQTVAILPWGVFLNHQTRENDPVHNILRRRPNPEISPFDFKRLLVSHALVWGNGYAEIERNGRREPVRLWPLLPSAVTVMRDENTKELFCRVSGKGALVDLPYADVFHLKNIGSDGIVGLSVIGLAARTIGMGIAAEEFGANLYRNQAIPSGVLKHPKQLSSEALERLRDQFGERFGGSANAGKPVVLEEGMEFTPLTFKPEDLQFLESRRFVVEDIARWFGLPPHKLSDMSRATFNNIEHQSISVVNDAIHPWCQALEEEANYKLLGNRRDAVYTKLDMRGLLRGDNASRADYYTKMLQNGVYSVNDVRELEDMAPIEHGDKHLVPLNQTTIENAGKKTDATRPEPFIKPGGKPSTENTDKEDENAA